MTMTRQLIKILHTHHNILHRGFQKTTLLSSKWCQKEIRVSIKVFQLKNKYRFAINNDKRGGKRRDSKPRLRWLLKTFY